MEKHSEIPFANQEFEPVLNQSRVEQHMLENAKDSLKTTMAWKTKGKTFTRKLSTLRFASGNFHEHLKRVFVLEEHDGYMHFVLENCPHFQERVSDLRREHDQIRGSLDAVTAKLDRLAPVDAVGLEEIEHEIASILDKYEHHNRKETSLIQDSLLIDNGCGD